MDSAELLAQLERLRSQPREGLTVEFKSNLNEPKAIGEYISALANSATLERHDRAWLVWGVEDGTHEVTGTSFNPFDMKAEGSQSLIMWLQQMTSPRADFQFHHCVHPNGNVVLLEIHPARHAPVAFLNVRYIRIDSHKSTLVDKQPIEARLWEVLGHKEDWSGALVPGATYEDLDPEALQESRVRFTEYLIKNEPDTTRHAQIRTDAQAWDVATLLNKARLTKQGKITRSAMLLLGRDESAHFLSPVDAKITWVLRDASNSTVSSLHFGMPLLLSTGRVFAKIRNEVVEHKPDTNLFPMAVQMYDTWVIREALHNCVAHQDYSLGGKINVVEHPDRLVFTNLGQFIPPSVEWMLEHQSPPELYRNQWLIDGMIRLRMIDQIGSGIRRMFQTQRERFFPLPDYSMNPVAGQPRVELTISGHVLDPQYTLTLMKRGDLELGQVLLLDRVQKGGHLTSEQAKELKSLKLVEGRGGKLYISSQVAAWAGQKASYIRTRGLDDSHYKDLLLEYLRKYHQATRKEVDDLLMSKLPEILNQDQKANKIRNMLQAMRNENLIERTGPKATPLWVLKTGALLDAEGSSDAK
jgi:ATP-dependent DNA helicase RecG